MKQQKQAKKIPFKDNSKDGKNRNHEISSFNKMPAGKVEEEKEFIEKEKQRAGLIEAE